MSLFVKYIQMNKLKTIKGRLMMKNRSSKALFSSSVMVKQRDNNDMCDKCRTTPDASAFIPWFIIFAWLLAPFNCTVTTTTRQATPHCSQS